MQTQVSRCLDERVVDNNTIKQHLFSSSLSSTVPPSSPALSDDATPSVALSSSSFATLPSSGTAKNASKPKLSHVSGQTCNTVTRDTSRNKLSRISGATCNTHLQPTCNTHLQSTCNKILQATKPKLRNTELVTTDKVKFRIKSAAPTLRVAAVLPNQPRMGTNLDTGADNHNATHVDNESPCSVRLIGVNSSTNITTKGTLRSLQDVYKNKYTPSNLISLSRLLTEGPYDSFCFQRWRKDHNRHDVWAIDFRTRERKLIAFRDPRVSPLYAVTDAALDMMDKPRNPTRTYAQLHTALMSAGRSNDVTEPVALDDIMNRLIYPAPSSLNKMLKAKTITGLEMSATDMRRHKNRSLESRLKGTMTASSYRRRKDCMYRNLTSLMYLDRIYCDTQELSHPGPKGEKYVFNMIDMATRYPWSIPHCDFVTLPALVERQIIKILDHARTVLGISNPQIRRIYIDGHPTQRSQSVTTVAPMEAMLNRRGIHCPKLPPGDHKQMGVVERLHGTLDSYAKIAFHSNGRGLSPAFFMYAYLHAVKVARVRGHSGLGGKSPFEMMHGAAPKLADIPFPSIFSSGYARDDDKSGIPGRRGFKHHGVIVDTGVNRETGHQLMQLYVPYSGIFIWRHCIVNSAVSTYPPNRIELMRLSKESILTPKEPLATPRIHTRTVTHAAAQLKFTRTNIPGCDDVYLHATRYGNDIDRAYRCVRSDCARHHEGCRTLLGLKRHMAWHHRRDAAQIPTTATAAPATVPTTAPATMHADRYRCQFCNIKSAERDIAALPNPRHLESCPRHTAITTPDAATSNDVNNRSLEERTLEERPPEQHTAAVPMTKYRCKFCDIRSTDRDIAALPNPHHLESCQRHTTIATTDTTINDVNDSSLEERTLEERPQEEHTLEECASPPAHSVATPTLEDHTLEEHDVDERTMEETTAPASVPVAHRTRYRRVHFDDKTDTPSMVSVHGHHQRTPNARGRTRQRPTRRPGTFYPCRKRSVPPTRPTTQPPAPQKTVFAMMAISRWSSAERDDRTWTSHQRRVRGRKAARTRRATQQAQMMSALDPGDSHTFLSQPEATPSMLDYVDERATEFKYRDLEHTVDPTPQYNPQCDWTTVRDMKDIPDDDDPLLLDTLRHDSIPGVHTSPKETQGFVYVAEDGDASLDEITQENAHKFEPTTRRGLEKCKFRKYWEEAQEVETATLRKYDAFNFVKVDGKVKMVTLRWIFKIKFENGKLQKFKARLVARGFTQRAGVDYDPSCVSAPVARSSTFLALLANAVHKHHFLEEFDVKCAYLLSKLTDTVYARVPYGMQVDPDTNALKLNRSLYGLKQSGYNWNKKFSAVLRSLRFRQSKVDPCHFIYEHDGDEIHICTWVDDGLVSASNLKLWHDIRAKLHEATPLGSKGPLKWLLGMSMDYDQQNGILRISQRAKIDALLEHYGMTNSRPLPTPLDPKEKIFDDGPNNAAERAQVVKSANAGGARFRNYADVVTCCREIIGAVGHLACWGRPDLRQAIYFMARYQARPSVRHYRILKNILRYLQGTKDLTLTFGQRSFNDKSPLVCMVDSDYIGTGDNCYSTTGYLFWFYGCPILCDSRKQTAVSCSTTEAELIAASMAAKTGQYLRRLIEQDFGFDGLTKPGAVPMILPPTPCGEDNQGTISISLGGGNHRRMRHIRVADSYIYQCILKGSNSIHYVRSADNVSDIFTKACDIETFRRLRWYLMGDAPNDEDARYPRVGSACFSWPISQDGNSIVEECWRTE